jgi:uncharacterized YccA/Bax inhibitor family protein
MALQLNQSGNPVLGAFRTQRRALAGESMTMQGTVNKSFLLLVVLIAAALYPWSQYMASGDVSTVSSSVLLGTVGGFILALIISFNATLAPYLSIPYAALQGLAIGGFSAILERRFPGIAIQAVGCTFAVMAAMLLAYTSRLIQVTQRFRSIVIVGTGAIALMYLLSFVLQLFHVPMPFLYNSSPLGIIISLVVIGFAALNLLLDFDMIESGVAYGAPRYMEWYAGFGLLVTLVWLYLEILRLFTRLRER